MLHFLCLVTGVNCLELNAVLAVLLCFTLLNSHSGHGYVNYCRNKFPTFACVWFIVHPDSFFLVSAGSLSSFERLASINIFTNSQVEKANK